MENKQLIILGIIILVAAIIIATGIYLGLTHTNHNNMANNTLIIRIIILLMPPQI